MGRYVHTGEHDSKPCRIFLRTELPEELSETEKELLSKVKLEIREGNSVIYEGDLESEGLWAAKVLEYAVQMNGKKSVFNPCAVRTWK